MQCQNNASPHGFPQKDMKNLYAVVPDFPQIVGIETTAHCNASCVFCPLHGSKSDMVLPKGVMSMRIFDKIVRELSAHRDGIDVIFLNVRGEPLLDPNFDSRLGMIKGYGLNDKISMQTNGQFLDMHKAQVILDNKIGQIVLGFDAASKGVYERHRINCDYETVLNNMRNFLELRDKAKSNVHVSIKYVYTHENQHEIKTAYKMWTKILMSRLDNFMISPSENWANSRIDSNGYAIKTTHNSNKDRVPCPLLVNSINVLYDGKVPACCWDYNLDISNGGMGDANDHQLSEIWDGKAFQNLRYKHANLDFEDLTRCAQCSQILKYDDSALSGHGKVIPIGGVFGYLRKIRKFAERFYE
jgi:MoaA/NifB/PqqE/SkfB family radical SAM enzyme